MRLTVVGSSDAFNSAGRAHSCYWLEGAGDGPIMVDFGATSLAALKRLGKDPRLLDAIAFTHLHGDHVGGWPFLFIDGLFNLRRERPLAVLGPARTKAKLDEVSRAAYGEIADWVPPWADTREELLPGESRALLGATVRGFAADHMDPPDRPLCLRITGKDGRSIAFSGDTRMCDGLFEAADGADLLVAECTAMRQPAGHHCTWEEWLDAFGRVKAKRILLTHLNEEVRASIPALLEAAPKGLALAFADDGLVVEV